MFSLRLKTLASDDKTNKASTLRIMGPAVKPHAGQHPTSHFFPLAVETALYSQEQIQKESAS